MIFGHLYDKYVYFVVGLVDLQPLAEEYMPLMESIYCNVIYTGKMGTALIPKVCKNTKLIIIMTLP